MKKLLWIVLIFTGFGYSQDCKYKKNEIDDFTKKKIIETKSEWLCENVAYSFKKNDDTKYLRVEIGSFKVFAISDGAKLMFLTDKEDPIVLIFQKYEISRTTPGAIASQYVSEIINISEDVLKRFQNEKITKVRIYTTDGYIDHDIKEKRFKRFQETLKCIQ